MPAVLAPASRPPLRARRQRRALLAGAAVLVALVLLGLVWGPGGQQGDAAPRLAPARAGPGLVRLVPDDRGSIARWIVSLGARDRATFLPAQAELLRRADGRIPFLLLYGRPEVREQLVGLLGEAWGDLEDRVTWRRTSHPMPPWIRDYFLLGETARGEPRYFLHHPEHYEEMNCGEVDSCADTYLATEAIAGEAAIPTPLRIEGGAVVVTEDHILLSEDSVRRALAMGEIDDVEDYRAYAEALWGRPVVLVSLGDDEPPHHCDLYLMPAGPGRMVVGSPALGARLLARLGPEERAAFQAAVDALVEASEPDDPLRLLPGVDLLDALLAHNADPVRQHAFGRVVEQLEGLGYACTEVPLLLPDLDAVEVPATFTYANVIQDERDGRRTVYLPHYGLPPLDDAASAIWASLGHRVVPVMSLGPALNGGATHCLSHALRAPAAASR